MALFNSGNIWSSATSVDGYHRTGRKRAVNLTTNYDTWRFSGAKTSTIDREIKISGLTPDAYDVRITRNTAISTNARESTKAVWAGMGEIILDDLYYPTVALLGLRIKATGQLSGNVNVTTLVQRAPIEVFDASGVSQGLRDLNNPAWIFWDILTNTTYGYGLPYAQIDFITVLDWATWCDEIVSNGLVGLGERRAVFNGVFDFSGNLWDALLKVCTIGRAAPIIRGTKYSVIVDKPGNMVQLFNMGNIIKSSLKTIYIGQEDVANEIEIQFVNKEKDYSNDTLIVVAPEIYSTNIQANKTSIQQMGITNQSQAYRAGRHLLYNNKYIRRTVEFEASVDSIESEAGDIIGVSHDVPAWGESGRLVSATSTTITLDKAILLTSGESYTITIRQSDNTFETFGIVFTGTIQVATLTINGTFVQTPSQYDIYSLIQNPNEIKLFRVASITRKNDQTRRVRAVEYNASIISDDTTIIDTTNTSELSLYPKIVSTNVTEHLEKRGDGTIVPFIDIDWKSDVPTFSSGMFTLYISTDGGVIYTKRVEGLQGSNYSMQVLDLEEDKEYFFKIVGKTIGTVYDSISNATSFSYTYLGKTIPPAPVETLSGTELGNKFTLTWTDPNKPVDFGKYTISYLGNIIGETTALTFTTDVIPTISSADFIVNAVDTTGNVSIDVPINVVVGVVPNVDTVTSSIVKDKLAISWGYANKPNDFSHYNILLDGTYIGTSTDVSYEAVAANHLVGSYTYSVVAVDSAGNKSTQVDSTVTITPPTVSNPTYSFDGNQATIIWDKVESSYSIDYYTIKDTVEYITSTSSITIPVTWTGSKVHTITVFDKAGNSSTTTVDIVVISPTLSNPIYTFNDNIVTLNWDITVGSCNIIEYALSGPSNYTSSTTSVSFTVDWAGIANYTLSVMDSAGNNGAIAVPIEVILPTISLPIYSFVNDIVTLSWTTVEGSCGIDRYTIDNGTVYTAHTSSFSFAADWLGNVNHTITVYDKVGNFNSLITGIDIVAPDAPVVTGTATTSGISFTWTTQAQSCGVKEYIVVYNGNQIITKNTYYSIPLTTQGQYNITVVAMDYVGNDSITGVGSVIIATPTVTNISNSFGVSTVTVDWTSSTGTFSVDKYKIEYTSTAGAQTKYTTIPSITITPDWVGLETFSITAIDVAGNIGITSNYDITIVAPDVVGVTSSVVEADVVFDLVQTKRSFDLKYIEVAYDSKIITITAGTPSWILPIFWDLSKDFTFTSIDILGNRSASIMSTVTIVECEVTGISANVVDNNVLLKWSSTPGTLPIERYSILKGDTYNTAVEIGIRKGTFTTIFESDGGVYTYWIVPIDTAGNAGVYLSSTNTISQPPDFILNVEWTSNFSGTLVNGRLTEDGNNQLLPVNLVNDYSTHFTNYSWTSPDEQVVAGYPLWLTPGSGSASYEQIFDYGTVLGSTSITLTDPAIIKNGVGNYSFVRQISTSLDGVAYTTHTVNASQVFASNIQYVKIKYTYTVDTDTLLTVGTFQLRLDSKIISDSGAGTSLATDSGGTLITFLTDFVDITAITVTPKGTTPLIAIYDFIDIPNPTDFKVLLYDTNGNRADGDFSWNASGY